MLVIFLVALVVSIGVSFFCSLMEAALYAVSLPYVKHRAESGHRAGKLLLQFKEDMGKPIAAILILNTVAHTAGASVAGWSVGELFGSAALLPFSIIYTLVVLYFSEILPKLIGVVQSKFVATAAAAPLAILIRLLFPLIWIADFFTRQIGPSKDGMISAQEVSSMAEIGAEGGALDRLEGSVIVNIIALDKLLVRDVMTPRVVVLRCLESMTLAEAAQNMENWAFSRIPLYKEVDPECLTGYVTQRDVLWALVREGQEKPLKEVSRPLKTVPELMRCDKLLLDMIENKEHICSVVDEHGALAGIITLEDIIEKIVGHEIVDEYDRVSNLRGLARVLRQKKWGHGY